MNCELQDVQAGFRKARGTRNQTANIHWIIEKAREYQKKHLFLLYWLRQSLWLCGSQQTEKFFKRREYQTTLTGSWEICLQVKKQRIELDMEHRLVPNGKGEHQGCVLSPCLFDYMQNEYILRNIGIKIAGRNINNLRYTNDTILNAESKEELKSILMKVKEESERLI